MSTPHNSLPHLPDPVAAVRAIGREAMLSRLESARRMATYRHEKSVVATAYHTARSFGLTPSPTRVTASRPLPPLDEEAFETALGAFHRMYAHAFRPAVPSDEVEAHHDALREALEAFLCCYEEMRR